MVVEEKVGAKAGPSPVPHPDRHIRLVAGEIDQAVAGLEPDRKLGPGDLEGAEMAGQPVRGEGLGGADREHALVLVDEVGEALAEPVERVRHDRGEPPPGLAQRDPPLRADEQGQAEPLLEQPDLIADRGLGHPQLARGEGEILVPGGRLEDPDGGQRREVAHRRR